VISTMPLLTGLSMALLCIALATILLPTNKLPTAARVIVITGIALLVMLPLSDYPVWYKVRGVFGDSSITALFFYIALVLQQTVSWQLYRERELVLLRRLVLVTAILLYPFALGLTQFDSYSLGYANPWMLAALLVFTLFFWFRQYYFLATMVTLAVIASSLHLLESRNLWDYLIDPAFVLIMLLSWFRPSIIGVLSSTRHTS
jgi:hypothetical protein